MLNSSSNPFFPSLGNSSTRLLYAVEPSSVIASLPSSLAKTSLTPAAGSIGTSGAITAAAGGAGSLLINPTAAAAMVGTAIAQDVASQIDERLKSGGIQAHNIYTPLAMNEAEKELGDEYKYKIQNLYEIEKNIDSRLAEAQNVLKRGAQFQEFYAGYGKTMKPSSYSANQNDLRDILNMTNQQQGDFLENTALHKSSIFGKNPLLIFKESAEKGEIIRRNKDGSLHIPDSAKRFAKQFHDILKVYC